MTAIYQNNFKKIKTFLKKETELVKKIDILAYPFHQLTFPHAHTSHSLGPWNEQYHSQLNHINLFQLVDPLQLADFGFALVRDGLFTLMDFFHRFPTPKDFNTVLIIHQQFRDYIPPKWESRIVFFDFEINKDFYKNKKYNDQLIVKGSVGGGIFENDYFFNFLSSLKKENIKKKILLCVSPRQNYFLREQWNGDFEFAQNSNYFMKRIYQELEKQFEVEFICWSDFFLMSDLHSYEFWDANKKSNVYVDDYSDFYLFKKGAKPYNIKNDSVVNHNPDDLIISLTHAHGIRILEKVNQGKVKHWENLLKVFEQLEIKKGEKLTTSAFQAILNLNKF